MLPATDDTSRFLGAESRDDLAALLCGMDGSAKGPLELAQLLVHDWDQRCERIFGMGSNLMVRSMANLVPPREHSLWVEQLRKLTLRPQVSFRGRLATHQGRFHREVLVLAESLPTTTEGVRRILLQLKQVEPH